MGSGVFDCPLGGGIGQSTTSLFLTGPIISPHTGFTISGAPSVSPSSFSAVAGAFSSMQFLQASKNGVGTGSAVFNVIGLTCGVHPAIAPVGSCRLTIPAITLTEISSGDIYVLDRWDASAVAGIELAASFKLSG